ncbi:TIGR02466 family protein [Synechococcus sp. CCY9201]|nr:TIGR02466 family protein [Synechococcus sp. CCY9201]
MSQAAPECTMPLHWLFPTPVLQEDLEPDASTAAAMEAFLAQLDRTVYQHERFSSRNNLTGDVLAELGMDQLHRLGEFQWLNRQLAHYAGLFLETLIGPDHGLELHIQKAWSVICPSQGGELDAHTHPNAQLSAVFYVRTEPDNPTGQLEFQAPETYYSHSMTLPYAEAAVSGGVFAAQTHRLLIFPSDLRHRVTPYEGRSSRYSVSYDLALTTPPGAGREMQVPHPLDWVPLSLV